MRRKHRAEHSDPGWFTRLRRRRWLFASLTTAALAAALHQAGAWNAIQLDINKSWTRFDRFLTSKGKLHVEPVLPAIIQDDRLLQPYSRDFFYLTATGTA